MTHIEDPLPSSKYVYIAFPQRAAPAELTGGKPRHREGWIVRRREPLKRALLPNQTYADLRP